MSSVFTGVVDTDRFCQHPQLHAPIPPASTHECHDHQHRHHHSHGEWQAGPARPHQERALRLSLLISAVMMVIELFVGWVTGSLLKFLSIYGLTQVPLAIIEGMVTTAILGILPEHWR